MTVNHLFVFALLFAPLLCLADEQADQAAGPIIDRIEVRVDKLRDSLDSNSREMGRWGERVDRIDGIRNREGKIIGSRLGTFLDRIERVFWLIVIAFVVACVAGGVACAAYGLERVSAGVQSAIGVVKAVVDTVKAWRAKA